MSDKEGEKANWLKCKHEHLKRRGLVYLCVSVCVRVCVWFEYESVGTWCVQWKSGKESLEGARDTMEGGRRGEGPMVQGTE